ncbi:MAG: acyl carrier protein [Gemmatimonadaceae bacterium]
MPVDPSLVTDKDLTAAVQRIVAQVLMVDPAIVHPETTLYSLGAESIDYLDLIFRVEEVIHKKVPVSRWESFVRERLPGANLAQAITVAFIAEFAEFERAGVGKDAP